MRTEVSTALVSIAIMLPVLGDMPWVDVISRARTTVNIMPWPVTCTLKPGSAFMSDLTSSSPDTARVVMTSTVVLNVQPGQLHGVVPAAVDWPPIVVHIAAVI